MCGEESRTISKNRRLEGYRINVHLSCFGASLAYILRRETDIKDENESERKKKKKRDHFTRSM